MQTREQIEDAAWFRRLFPAGQSRGERVSIIIAIAVTLIFTGMTAYSYWYMWQHADQAADADD